MSCVGRVRKEINISPENKLGERKWHSQTQKKRRAALQFWVSCPWLHPPFLGEAARTNRIDDFYTPLKPREVGVPSSCLDRRREKKINPFSRTLFREEEVTGLWFQKVLQMNFFGKVSNLIFRRFGRCFCTVLFCSRNPPSLLVSHP